MEPPNPFVRRKSNGYSLCIAGDHWTQDNQIFFADGRHLVLCETDFADFWENTDEIPADYQWYNVGK